MRFHSSAVDTGKAKIAASVLRWVLFIAWMLSQFDIWNQNMGENGMAANTAAGERVREQRRACIGSDCCGLT
jgi:hypothetical protein